MYLFFLGVILGFGLHAAVRGGLKTLQLRRIRKDQETELEVERRVSERLNPVGWDWAQPNHDKRFVPIRHP